MIAIMKRILPVILIVLIIFAFCCAGFGQAEKPITKANLLSSVRLGRREKKTAARYIELIMRYGVDFLLTPNEEQTLRRSGGYLGKKGLDDLVVAVRDNYRREGQKAEMPAIVQSMTSSPGGIQAGRDVVINQKPAWRKLTDEQRVRFLSIVRSLSPAKGHVDILSVLGDAESDNFATQLDAVLKEAGWSTGGTSAGIFTGVPVGLVIQVHDKDNAKDAAILQHALGQIGFQVEGGFQTQVPIGVIKLIVGVHP